jgi:hypothetical protein
MKIKPFLMIIALASSILSSIGQSVMAQDYEQLPHVEDGQAVSTPVSITATADMDTLTPTVITIEDRGDWCYGRYFVPSAPGCIEEIGNGGMIRTVWTISCSDYQVTESSELVDRTVQVGYDSLSKNTQQAYRIFVYACGDDR